MGGKVVDDTFNCRVQRLCCDQCEEQNKQEAVIADSRPCKRKHNSAYRQGQQDMAKRRFLPQTAEAADGISCGDE